MALELAVRGTSITELENAPLPPSEIFDIGSVKLNITSKAIARPISPKPIQANGSVKVKVTSKALDEPVLPTPFQNNASSNINIGSKALSQPVSPTALQRNDAFAIKTRKSIVGSMFESPPPSEVRQVWEKSIGTSCRQLGKSKLQCWEAEGPALELTRELVSDIRKHLNCKTDYIYGRKAVRPPLILGIYMVGKSSADARPFLVVSCEQDEPRERAMKLIKKSKILDQFEEKGGVRLREQRRPPISTGPVTLVSGVSSQDMSTRNATRVYYDPAHGTLLSSLQLYIQISNGSGTVCWHKATIGCFLWFRGRYLAFTAAHPFLDLPSSPGSDEESELDFPFEDDSETSAAESDEDDFEDPPNASISSHPSTMQRPSIMQRERAAKTTLPRRGSSDSSWVESVSTAYMHSDAGLQLEEFGFLFASSIGRGTEASLDWALIEVTQPRLDSDAITLMNGATNFDVLREKPLKTKVLAKTASNGTLHGDLSPMPTFMLLPGSPKFQEVWTVRFAGHFDKGDCGTLVVDLRGNIYGHLVAGDLENNIGYLVPAMPTFENMKQQIGNDLSTIRPPLSNLEAPLSPKSVERTGNASSTTRTWRYGVDPTPPSEEGQHIMNDLPTNRSPPTDNILNFSEAQTEARQVSESTLIDHITFDNQMPTTSPDIWGTIEHAGPSIRRFSRMETMKFTEKAPESAMPNNAISSTKFTEKAPESAMSNNAGIPTPHEPTGSGNIIRCYRILNEWLNPFPPQQQLDLRNTISMNDTHRSFDIMDNAGFQRQVLAITGSGIFASSYAFFVPGIILPALNFVYWPNTLSLNKNYQVRVVGLAASILGSLLAGPVADIFGRRQLYRFGPVALLVGAIGFSGSSAGFNNSSMSMFGWTLFWQFIIGLGIGVEWTLSAVVSAEFSSARSRSRLMAAVFLMQPLSNLIASALALVLLVTLGRNSGLAAEVDEQNAALVVDKMWRIVVGLGGVPAIITLFLRMAMPESPRYTLELCHEEGSTGLEISPGQEATDNEMRFGRYLIASRSRNLGNWRHLAVISICAFILNAAMVSLGADNYRVLAQIWDFDTSHTNSTTTLPAWTDGQRASAIPGEAIYGVLFDFSQHSIFTQSISSAVGSLVLVMIIQRFFFRRFALICSSIILAGLFILLGTISLLTAVSSATRGAIGIATMILSYFAFSLGPIFLLFMLPTEMFPTSYRATCFALVYSSGKIGSIVVQSIPSILYSNSERPRIIFLFGMAGCLIVAAVFASAWLPWYRRSRIGWGYRDGLGLETLCEQASNREMEAPGFRRTWLKWFRYKGSRNL